MRRVLSRSVKFTGIGLHGGQPVAMTVEPARAGAGISFQRTDAGDTARPILARYDMVRDTRLCTVLANDDGLLVGTVEHLMAALAGCGLTDALIRIDGPEVPIMDGSALPFVMAFLRSGFNDLQAPNPVIRILEPVEVVTDGKRAALLPSTRAEMEYTISFDDPAIGTQSRSIDLTGGAVVTELSDSRTFGLLADVEALRSRGLGRGGSIDNVVVVDDGRVLNPGGLRHSDEFVRHKMLDAVGDLALAGAPIIGRYVGYKAGHALTNLLLRALFARTDAWTWDDASPQLVPGGDVALPAETAERPPLAV